MNFKELDLIEELQKAVQEVNYTTLTPIQEKAIPAILKGADVLGTAKTGTGKTAAFAIPTLQRLKEDIDTKEKSIYVKALVITPTRELAIQIHNSFETYGKYLPINYGVIYGGISQKAQEEKVRGGVDILVATPGRLRDFVEKNIINIRQIKVLILDEADQMLDMGFIDDIKYVLSKTPLKKQTLLFSATMPYEIANLSRSILVEPTKISISEDSTPVESIEQSLYMVDSENKKQLLLEVLRDDTLKSVLIFTRTKNGAEKVTAFLLKNSLQAEVLHGGKTQYQRQEALELFKDNKLKILVATDVAARGIDIDELSMVINYDLPTVPQNYIHRIGRTGRAGLEGRAISFCDINERELLSGIEELLNKKIPVVKEHAFPATKKKVFKPLQLNQMQASEEEIDLSQIDMKNFRMTASGTLKEKKSKYRSSSKNSPNERFGQNKRDKSKRK